MAPRVATRSRHGDPGERSNDFAGWHEVCSIHAEGSFATQKMMLLAEAPSKDYKSKARDIVGLDG